MGWALSKKAVFTMAMAAMRTTIPTIMPYVTSFSRSALTPSCVKYAPPERKFRERYNSELMPQCGDVRRGESTAAWLDAMDRSPQSRTAVITPTARVKAITAGPTLEMTKINRSNPERYAAKTAAAINNDPARWFRP